MYIHPVFRIGEAANLAFAGARAIAQRMMALRRHLAYGAIDDRTAIGHNAAQEVGV